MPSSGKTQNIELNKWLGDDKPKKDDFNTDNQKLDSAFGVVMGDISRASQDMAAHNADTSIHVTQAEREMWNKMEQSIMGTYQGNGAGQRKIELGFAPRFGILFSLTNCLIKFEFDSGNSSQYTGIFTSLGCSEGLSCDSTGFSVTNYPSPRPNGNTPKMNESGTNYLYIVWK